MPYFSSISVVTCLLFKIFCQYNKFYYLKYFSPFPTSVCLDNRFQDNAVYCIYCVLLVPKDRRNILGAFVNRGYREWHNIMQKEKKYPQNTYHQETVTLARAAIDRFEKPESTIPGLIDNSIKKGTKPTQKY